MNDHRMALFTRISEMQQEIHHSALNPMYQVSNLTTGLSHLYSKALGEAGFEQQFTTNKSFQASTVYDANALLRLAEELDARLASHGGDTDPVERGKAVNGTIRSIFVAAEKTDLGDLVLLTRVVPRLMKGAFVTVPFVGNRSLYHYLRGIGELPYFDARILPWDSLALITEFMLTPANRRW